MDIDEFNNIVKACYQGPLEADLWASFLKILKKQFQARFVTLLLRPPKAGDTGVVLNAFVSSDRAYNDYNQRYFSQDPFVGLPLGKAITADEVLDMQHFKQSDYYRDFLQPVGVEYILGADFEDENGYGAGLRISRDAKASNFTQQDKLALELIVPHITQAIVLYSRMVHAETKAQTYQDAFNHMEMGCISLDRNMKVISKNQAATDLMRVHDCFYIKDKQLYLSQREESKRLKQIIDSMVEVQLRGEIPEVVAFKLNTAHSMAGLGILCRALPPSATPDAGPSLALFISDPEKPRLNKVTILEQLFGLTLSESRLALLLANGFSLDEAAEELGITRNTAKSHLSSTFNKTGVARQPSLVQLILRSVASLG